MEWGGVMAERPRLQTNTIWSLEDALGGFREVWPLMKGASERAEKLEDVKLLGRLNQMGLVLMRIERHVRNARAGKYETEVGD